MAKFGPYAPPATVIGAVVLMLVGLLVSGLSTGLRLLAVGVGAVALFIGFSMLAPKLVPPLVKVLGWPATKIGGAAGKLAEGNSARNPARTASTASALMIGLALVTLVACWRPGCGPGSRAAVNEGFVANYAITATNNFSPISLSSERPLRGVPGATASWASAPATGRRSAPTSTSPAFRRTSARRSTSIGTAGAGTPAELGSDGAFVDKDYAKAQHLQVGSPLSVETPTGRFLHLKLIGITNPPKGGSLYGDVTISQALFDSAYQNPQNLYTFVNMQGGVTPANTHTLNAALAGFPDAKLQTKSQFIDNQLQGLNSILNLLYVLLSLSIVVSLFGIVNTLVLTVFERTRELGMLRAVGMSRRQVRRMIRHESVITALLGAAFGIRSASCWRR